MQKCSTTCDICSSVFKEGTGYQCGNIKNELGGTFTIEIEVCEGFDCDKELKYIECKNYDLCPKCAEKVLDFIKKLKNQHDMVI